MGRKIRRFKAFVEALWYVIIGNMLLLRKWDYIGGSTMSFWTIRLRVICKQKNFIK